MLEAFKERLPSAELSKRIECYWQLTLNAKRVNAPELQVPQGIFDVIFCTSTVSFNQFDGKSFTSHKLEPGCWLVGQQTTSYYWHAEKRSQLFGIRFKPFGLFRSNAISPHELKNRIENLAEISPNYTDSIERVLTSLFALEAKSMTFPTFLEQTIVAESFARTILNNEDDFPSFSRESTNLIMRHRGDIKLSDLCLDFKLSKATLRNRFIQSIGMLPKELCKIWRLNHLMLLKQRNPDINFTELALLAGYYDQAHLNKEFKSVLQQTPIHYFKRPTPMTRVSAAQISKRFYLGYIPRKVPLPW